MTPPPLSLRQRKAAQTRIKLLEALLERLHERPLSEITVKELCGEVPCSVPTFFNHFESKEHLLIFFIQLWSVEMAWQAAHKGPVENPLDAIEQIFVQTARYTVANPGIMAEILAFQARSRLVEAPSELTQAEILLAHPDKSGIEAFRASEGGLDALLPPLLEEAVRRGLLPAQTDIPAAFFALGSIFFGTVVLGRQSDLAYLEPMYQHQLRLLWAGLRNQA